MIVAISLLVMTMFAAGPQTASAAVTCNSNFDSIGTGTVFAVIYETSNYNSGQDGAHSGGLCIRASSTGGINIPILKNVDYNNPLDTSVVCDGQLATSYNTWNDCAGSLKVSLDCHHDVDFYSSENYSGLMYSYSASANNPGPWGIGWDNVMSSIKVIYHSVCQSAPAP